MVLDAQYKSILSIVEYFSSHESAHGLDNGIHFVENKLLHFGSAK